MNTDGTDRIEIDTPFGPIWLNGRATGRPILLLLNGLYANDRFAGIIRSTLPNVDVFAGRLPGDHAPSTMTTSLGVHAAAYSYAIGAKFGDAPLLVVGVSVGGLIAMALRAPSVRRLLVMDPPLRTGELWSLAKGLRLHSLPGWEDLAWPLFGIDATRHEARD